MKDAFLWIGSFIASSILMSIPILLTCSVIMDWDAFIQIILAILFVFEYTILILDLYYKSDEE